MFFWSARYFFISLEISEFHRTCESTTETIPAFNHASKHNDRDEVELDTSSQFAAITLNITARLHLHGSEISLYVTTHDGLVFP